MLIQTENRSLKEKKNNLTNKSLLTSLSFFICETSHNFGASGEYLKMIKNQAVKESEKNNGN